VWASRDKVSSNNIDGPLLEKGICTGKTFDVSCSELVDLRYECEVSASQKQEQMNVFKGVRLFSPCGIVLSSADGLTSALLFVNPTLVSSDQATLN